jgi:hypothetical protein
MYEHRTQPLLHPKAFLRRAFRHVGAGFGLVGAADAIGTLGYHHLAGQAWDDAFLNASMILAGMGQVGDVHGSTAKVFAALYALFCGLVFVAFMAVVLSPWVHRLIHRVHLDTR